MARPDQEFDEEIQAHLELLAGRFVERGMSREEAEYAARREFGNSLQLKEARAEMHRWNWLDQLWQDVHYACRMLKKNPGFSTVVALTMGLGIGANTSIFSVVHAVLLRPLPYRDAGGLVELTNMSPSHALLGPLVPDFQYGSWRDDIQVLDGIAIYTRRQFTITEGGEPERLWAQAVSPGFLRVLGVAPVVGRDLMAGDAAPRGGQVALISHRLWSRRFGRDPSIVNRSITLDGKPYTVAGVLPPAFEFPSNNDVSVLVALPEPASQPGGVMWFYSVIARMKPGVSNERLQADLSVVNRHLAEAYPDRFKGARADVQTKAIGLHDYLIGNAKPALLILSSAVALVLLIACVNIGNLLLARAISRRKEIAVRIALGAPLGRVFRQLLTESLLLAGVGGFAGLALAFVGVKFLIAIAPANVPHMEAAHISLPVLVFNFAVAAGSGLIFGIAPLRRATAPDPVEALKQTGRASAGGRNYHLFENFLIVTEVAFAMILVIGAGLLIRTFAGLTAITTGFHPEGVMTAEVSLPHWKYPSSAKNRAFFDRLLSLVRNSPGVASAAVVGALPYGGFAMSGALEVEGSTVEHSESSDAAVDYASDGYFESIGIAILEGRAFNRLDTAASESVAVVNQAFVLRYFQGGRALGKRIKIKGVTEWLRVVGVFGNVKQSGLASETRPQLFQPASQSESGNNAQTLVVRSKVNEKVLMPLLRRHITELDSELPPPQMETMHNIVAGLAASQRFVMQLLTLFAGLALVLAAIGIYGVLVYSVEQRTKEIGIRMALGAERSEVMTLILGRGLRLSISGAALGIAGASVATGYLRSLLYGVSPHDPATIVAGCATLVTVAAFAAWLPARRAVSVDPMVALRNE